MKKNIPFKLHAIVLHHTDLPFLEHLPMIISYFSFLVHKQGYESL